MEPTSPLKYKMPIILRILNELNEPNQQQSIHPNAKSEK